MTQWSVGRFLMVGGFRRRSSRKKEEQRRTRRHVCVPYRTVYRGYREKMSGRRGLVLGYTLVT
jgi:hypothetical protein